MLARLGIGQLGRNTLFTTSGLVFRAAIQAVYLIVLSRWMGAHNYGLFAGSVAAVMFLAPVAGWGINVTLSRQLAQRRSGLRELWPIALGQIAVSGSLLSMIVLIGAAAVLHERVGFGAMALIACAELIALPVNRAAASAALAIGRGGSSALVVCLIPLGRTIAVCVAAVLVDRGAPGTVAVLHFAGTVTGAFAAHGIMAYLASKSETEVRPSPRAMVREGGGYAAGALLGTSYQQVDKVLMLQLLGASVVGPYTAAFRFVVIFTLPLTALVTATLPKLFGSADDVQGARTLRAVTLAGAAYSLLAVAVLAAGSPFVPMIFGAEYVETARYVLLLAPWPFIFALHQIFATALTGSGRQRLRVAIETSGLILIATLNLALLTWIGPSGAIVALLVSEAFMALMCGLVLWFVLPERVPVRSKQDPDGLRDKVA